MNESQQREAGVVSWRPEMEQRESYDQRAIPHSTRGSAPTCLTLGSPRKFIKVFSVECSNARLGWRTGHKLKTVAVKSNTVPLTSFSFLYNVSVELARRVEKEKENHQLLQFCVCPGYLIHLGLRGLKLISTRGHISLRVAFKGPNVTLGLYTCNYHLTRG